MNDLSKSLKILVDRYPGTMAELARQAQIDRSSLYKIMDGKRMPNRAQLQRLIHALGLNARQAEHLTTQYDELRSGAQAHRTDEALYELLQTAMRSRDNLMNDVLAPMPRSEADLEAAFTSRCYQGYQAVTQQLHLLLTRYLRSEEKRPLMLSPFVGERALSSILIGAFSAEASPKPVWHLLRFVTNNDAQENFIGNVRTVSRALPFLVLRSMQYEARLSCAPSADAGLCAVPRCGRVYGSQPAKVYLPDRAIGGAVPAHGVQSPVSGSTGDLLSGIGRPQF